MVNLVGISLMTGTLASDSAARSGHHRVRRARNRHSEHSHYSRHSRENSRHGYHSRETTRHGLNSRETSHDNRRSRETSNQTHQSEEPNIHNKHVRESSQGSVIHHKIVPPTSSVLPQPMARLTLDEVSPCREDDAPYSRGTAVNTEKKNNTLPGETRASASHHAHKHNNSAAEEKPTLWVHKLCEIDAPDTGICCLGVFFPCILYGKTQARLTSLSRGEDINKVNNTCSSASCWSWIGGLCICSFLPTSLQHSRIRAMYNIMGNRPNDCARAYFCPCCSLIQADRELRVRESTQAARFDTGIGADTITSRPPGTRPPMSYNPPSSWIPPPNTSNKNHRPTLTPATSNEALLVNKVRKRPDKSNLDSAELRLGDRSLQSPQIASHHPGQALDRIIEDQENIPEIEKRRRLKILESLNPILHRKDVDSQVDVAAENEKSDERRKSKENVKGAKKEKLQSRNSNEVQLQTTINKDKNDRKAMQTLSPNMMSSPDSSYFIDFATLEEGVISPMQQFLGDCRQAESVQARNQCCKKECPVDGAGNFHQDKNMTTVNRTVSAPVGNNVVVGCDAENNMAANTSSSTPLQRLTFKSRALYQGSQDDSIIGNTTLVYYDNDDKPKRRRVSEILQLRDQTSTPRLEVRRSRPRALATTAAPQVQHDRQRPRRNIYDLHSFNETGALCPVPYTGTKRSSLPLTGSTVSAQLDVRDESGENVENLQSSPNQCPTVPGTDFEGLDPSRIVGVVESRQHELEDKAKTMSINRENSTKNLDDCVTDPFNRSEHSNRVYDSHATVEATGPLLSKHHQTSAANDLLVKLSGEFQQDDQSVQAHQATLQNELLEENKDEIVFEEWSQAKLRATPGAFLREEAIASPIQSAPNETSMHGLDHELGESTDADAITLEDFPLPPSRDSHNNIIIGQDNNCGKSLVSCLESGGHHNINDSEIGMASSFTNTAEYSGPMLPEELNPLCAQTRSSSNVSSLLPSDYFGSFRSRKSNQGQSQRLKQDSKSPSTPSILITRASTPVGPAVTLAPPIIGDGPSLTHDVANASQNSDSHIYLVKSKSLIKGAEQQSAGLSSAKYDGICSEPTNSADGSACNDSYQVQLPGRWTSMSEHGRGVSDLAHDSKLGTSGRRHKNRKSRPGKKGSRNSCPGSVEKKKGPKIRDGSEIRSDGFEKQRFCGSGNYGGRPLCK